MNKVLLSALLGLCISGVHGQNTSPREEQEQNEITRSARASVNKNIKSLEQQDGRVYDYYIAFDVTQLSRERSFEVTFEKGTTPPPPKQFEADLPNLNRLISSRIGITHELDLINYLSSMGWEMAAMVDIPGPRDKAIRKSKIYFKKTYRN